MAADETSSPAAFQLRITPDQMTVLLDCTLEAEAFSSLCGAIRDELLRMGVYQPPRTSDLEASLGPLVESQPALERYPLLHGLDMIPPVDARIEWADDFFSTGFVVDPQTGAMNYRERIARSTVAKGELLATVIPGQEGTPGRDVLGKAVKPPKIKIPRIKAGANVRHDEAMDAYFSEVDGRIRWKGGTLSVDDVYRVNGSVGLETGNIDHPGALVIDHDILTDARIKTGGDIDVHGLVEAADIDCGGNLTVQGGITGGEGHRIKVKGVLKAKFILDADVEAEGGVVVEKEILHSKVHSRGPVEVASGRIIGGAISALGGITVGEAGSDAGVPTHLATGVDAIYEAELEQKSQELSSLHTRAEKIHTAIDGLLPHLDKLPPDKRESIQKLVDGVKVMEARMEELSLDVEELKEDFNARAHHEIHIRRRMHPECILTVRHRPKKMTSELEGPLTVFSVGGEIRLKAG